VAALNIAEQLHARYCELEDHPQDEATRVGIKMGLITAFGHFVNYAALGALFFFTGKLFTASNYTLDLQSALIALFEAFNVTFTISSNYHFIPNINEAVGVANKLLSYFD
jgi:predicted Kef-type K+ transport protein